MSQYGYLQTPEGRVYWSYEEPKEVCGQKFRRPTLLFIHAGVADHRLWDEQVVYFTERGWGVLRYDIFGYGLSKPNADYLGSDPRPKVKHHEHAASIATTLLSVKSTLHENPDEQSGKFVAIGLSRGGGIATELTVAYPSLICGLVIIASGLPKLDPPNQPDEDALLGEWLERMQNGEIEKAATILTHYWGDGPMVEGARMEKNARDKLYVWIEDITQREADRTGGGFCIPYEGPEPPAVERLSSVNVPVATATGKWDESSTTAGMRVLSTMLRTVSNREFETAHMVNLEQPDLFNAWLEDYLNQHIH